MSKQVRAALLCGRASFVAVPLVRHAGVVHVHGERALGRRSRLLPTLDRHPLSTAPRSRRGVTHPLVPTCPGGGPLAAPVSETGTPRGGTRRVAWRRRLLVCTKNATGGARAAPRRLGEPAPHHDGWRVERRGGCRLSTTMQRRPGRFPRGLADHSATGECHGRHDWTHTPAPNSDNHAWFPTPCTVLGRRPAPCRPTRSSLASQLACRSGVEPLAVSNSFAHGPTHKHAVAAPTCPHGLQPS